MKRFKLKASSGSIIKKRKGLKFTPIAIQVGELPQRRVRNENK